MSASLSSIGFSCIVFLALQQVATGLMCYDCLLCSSVSSSTATINSTATGSTCYKAVVGTLGVTAVTRGLKTDCIASSVSGSGMYCCSTDLCNGSVSLYSSLVLTLALVAAVTFLKSTKTN